MLQNIIVISIIIAAIAYTLYAVIKSLTHKNATNCDDCSGCDVKQEILKSLKDKNQVEPFNCGDFKSSPEKKT